MPRRPFVVLGFSAFAGALTAVRAGPELSLTLAAIAGVLAFCAVIWAACTRRRPDRGNRAVIMAMACGTCAVVFAMYCYAWHTQVEPYQSFDGTKRSARVQIMDYPEKRYNRYYYPATIKRLDGKRLDDPIPVRLSCAEPVPCKPYQLVDAQVVFYSFRDDGSQFSTRNSQLADGNVLGAYISGPPTQKIGFIHFPPRRLTAILREGIGRGISRLLPDGEAGLAKAVLLGQRSNVPAGVSSDLSRIGCSHLMAVSGLHITVLAAFLTLFIGQLPLGVWGRNGMCMVVLFCYLCVIGFPASASRGCLMYFLYLLAQALGRRPDSLNSLGFAVLVLCLTRPFSGGDLGFVLSVSASAGIVLLFRPLMRLISQPLAKHPRLRYALRPVRVSFAVTLGATAFTLPVQLEVFGGISPLMLLSNLLLVPLFTLLLYFAVPLAALAFFPQTAPLAWPFSFFVGWLARLIFWAADQMASLPGSYFSFHSEALLAGLAALCLIGCRALMSPRRSKRPELFSALLILAVAIWANFMPLEGAVTFALAEEEDSACILVMKDGRGAVLSLGGYNSGRAERMFDRENIGAIDSVFLPVQDYNARAMAADLLESHSAALILLPEGAYIGKDLRGTGVPVMYIPEEMIWEILPGVKVRYRSEEGLRIQANGREIECRFSDGCAMSISGLERPLEEGALTVLFCGEGTSKEELYEGRPAGEYLPLDGKSLFIRIRADGDLRLEMDD